MKLFELTGHTYDKGWHYNMVKSGEMITPRYLVNPDDISSVKEWKGELLQKGLAGTKVIMKTGHSYVDTRGLDELKTDLEAFK